MHKKEDETHIMTQCTYEPWTKARATCENEIKTAWTKEEWEEYTKMKHRTKTLTLLGLPFDKPELRQSEEAWDERDGQERITIIANKARELREQQQGMNKEQKQARRTELEEMRKTQRKQQREDDRDEQLLQQIQERQKDPFGEATH
jgi:hypothetical protein